MLYNDCTITLKNGQQAILRSPKIEDAASLLDQMTQCYFETDFLSSYPEEVGFTEKEEAVFIRLTNESPTSMMVICMIDDTLAACCMLTRNTKIKTKHRASIALSVLKKYWGLGIGSALMDAVIKSAREMGILQLELEVYEANHRAISLYEKKGFVITGTKPNAYILKDGTAHGEHFMIKTLAAI